MSDYNYRVVKATTIDFDELGAGDPFLINHVLHFKGQETEYKAFCPETGAISRIHAHEQVVPLEQVGTHKFRHKY